MFRVYIYWSMGFLLFLLPLLLSFVATDGGWSFDVVYNLCMCTSRVSMVGVKYMNEH